MSTGESMGSAPSGAPHPTTRESAHSADAAGDPLASDESTPMHMDDQEGDRKRKELENQTQQDQEEQQARKSRIIEVEEVGELSRWIRQEIGKGEELEEKRRKVIEEVVLQMGWD